MADILKIRSTENSWNSEYSRCVDVYALLERCLGAAYKTPKVAKSRFLALLSHQSRTRPVLAELVFFL